MQAKKQATLEYYDELSRYSYELLDIKERKNIKRYLSKLDRLAVGIEAEVFDFDILYHTSRKNLTKRYEELAVSIAEIRKEEEDFNLYNNFENLIKRFQNCETANPNKEIEKIAEVW